MVSRRQGGCDQIRKAQRVRLSSSPLGLAGEILRNSRQVFALRPLGVRELPHESLIGLSSDPKLRLESSFSGFRGGSEDDELSEAL